MDRREQGISSGRSQPPPPIPAAAANPLAACGVQARLIALVAAQQLSLPMSEMESRLEALMVILPDLGRWRLRLARPCAACHQSEQPVLITRHTAVCGPCPHAAGRIPRLQPSLLAALTADLNTTSSRLLGLRELLPDANVSALVAGRPQLLLQDTAEVQSSVTALQRLLGVDHVDR